MPHSFAITPLWMYGEHLNKLYLKRHLNQNNLLMTTLIQHVTPHVWSRVSQIEQQ